MTPPDDLHPDTRAVRGGRNGCDPALAPVIWASSTFVSPDVDTAQAAATSIGSDRFYSRYGNPTVADFESAVAGLEGAEAARAYGSGMGAVTGVILGLCSKGDHIVATRQIYAATQLVLQVMCPRFGIDVTFVDGTEPGAMAAAVQPGKTMLVWAETPANPRLDLVDLDELGAIAGPMTVVDSTFATPFGQRPLDHGVDIVVHSATKAMAGHNDATLGVVATSAELVQWLTGFAVLQGAVASPYDAANGIRGLRTLPVRFARQTASALEVAGWLEKDGRVSEVRHPGLESHPQHELAVRQMRSTGGLVCFDLPGGIEAGRRFVDALELAQLATSLGGPETLVTHPASTTHVNLLPEELEAAGIGPGTIRLSVGLEHADDIR
ncbi:MAG TPA: aminotransferase class I/II-fold pyridoxal phosphate-dependent enzyme, partial [Iamia sp.]